MGTMTQLACKVIPWQWWVFGFGIIPAILWLFSTSNGSSYCRMALCWDKNAEYLDPETGLPSKHDLLGYNSPTAKLDLSRQTSYGAYCELDQIINKAGEKPRLQ